MTQQLLYFITGKDTPRLAHATYNIMVKEWYLKCIF